jgi:nitrite reductase/ring-hydroxylating ferredoxin subunit
MPGMKNATLIPLCGIADVAPGCAMRAESGGCAYAVFNVENKLYVTQDGCTHGPGSLAEGYVLDDEVECPFHQGRFHIPSGRATCAPATEALKTWKAVVIDGKVWIDPTENEGVPGQ